MSDEEIHVTVDSVVPETTTDAPVRPEVRDGELTCPCGDVLVEGASPWVAGQLELYCCTCQSRFELGTLRELSEPQSAPAVNGDAGASAAQTPVRLDAEKLTRLRVAAEAAGGERWAAHEVTSGEAWVTPERARHIAEADPATVLALLDRIEDLERMAGHVEWYADRLRQRCAALYAVAGRVAEFEAELKDLSRKALKGGERR